MKPFYAVLARDRGHRHRCHRLRDAQGSDGGMATEHRPGARRTRQALLERAEGVTVGSAGRAGADDGVQRLHVPRLRTLGRTQVEQMLKAEFVETGRVHYTYYDFPLGGNFKHSFVGVRAARCAGDQGRFWEYHDRLMASSRLVVQPVHAHGHFLTRRPQPRTWTMRQFESCLRSDQHAEVVTANRCSARRWA
jgi:hypothetical protein